MDLYQSFIHKSRYARYIPELKRREHYPETIKRYFDFMSDHLVKFCNYDLTPIRKSLEQAVNQMEVMPSMRSLMTAGKALDRDHTAGYNCLSGDTLVTTLERGICPIADLENQQVHVVDGNSQWTLSECKSYGEQNLFRINFGTSGNGNFYVDATADHRWIMRDGSEKTTLTLIEGDRIASVNMPNKPTVNDLSDDYLKGVQHGIIYGDGTANYRTFRNFRTTLIEKVCKGYVIRLCGTSAPLLSYFKEYSVSYPKTYNGDPVIYIFDRAVDLKSPPNVDTGFFTDDYLVGFIRGWLAADGSVTTVGGQVSVSGNKESYDWILKNGPKYGFCVRNCYTLNEDTNFKRSQTLYTTEFDRRWLCPDDFILEYKRNKFNQIDPQQHPGFGMIKSIIPLSKQKVYCFNVPTTHSFLLTRNLLTGNCSFVPIDDPKAFDEAMFILMCGGGVGFSVERQYVNKLPEVPDQLYESDTIINVKDSKEGWCKALRMLLALLYSGEIPKWDTTKVRPAGAKLKTFGGRSSGPEPLEQLFKFIVMMFRNAQDRKLTSLECHDIMCKIGDVVVMGGVRRCLPETTSVHTKNGIKQLKNVIVNDMVWTGKGYQKVVAKENTGKKQLWKISTQLGDYYSSADHRWAILNRDYQIEYKQANQLTEDDLLVAYCNVLPGTKTQLPPFKYEKTKHSTTCVDIVIPELDKEIAWFIGQLHADGYVNVKSNRGSVSIACSNDIPEQHKRVCANLLKFGVNVYNPPCYEQCTKPRANSKQLALYFSQFKQPKTTIDIPCCIKEGTVDVRVGYLAGLFDGDGYLPLNTTQKAPVVLSTVYYDFAEQVRDLLSSVGLFSVIKLVRNQVDNWQPIYNVQIFSKNSINQWNQLVAPHSTKHQQYGITDSVCEQRSFKAPHCDKQQSYNSWQEQNSTQFSWFPVSINQIEATDLYQNTCDIEVENDNCFVVGGGLLTHNSAMLSLSNLSDDRMRNAKSGAWWEASGHRALSNNSAVYNERPDVGMFMEEWLALYNSKSGERGIFNRQASQEKAISNGRRDGEFDFGTNPCSEIILRPYQFCNLTEVVVRSEDTLKDLKKKVRLAAILGTIQATLTEFHYLRKIWKQNTEQERLLGVSLTGILDNGLLNDYKSNDLPKLLQELKQVAIDTNKEFAALFGIPQSAAITCVKPSGTVSQLVDSASGIHPRHDHYYFRRVRNDFKDPLTKFLIDSGVPMEPDVRHPNTTAVFTFPKKAPTGAVTRNDMTAIDHLNLWLVYQRHWCEHKPSVTISVKEKDWPTVGAWVWEHFDELSGISFLPYDGGIYQQPPYETITEQQYNTALETMPKTLDWDTLIENEDETEGTQTLACVAGCEL